MRLGFLTWVGEEERKAETALDNEWEDSGREVEGDDALCVRTK